MKIGGVELSVPEFQDSRQDMIKDKLTALLGSVEGTYPMNRRYGISSEIFDCTVETAESILAAEIYDKTEEFIPEINVLDVQFRKGTEDDVLCPLISCEMATEEEDDLSENNDRDSEGDEYESDR